MKVTRDFGPGIRGGVEYHWYAEVEGKIYAYTTSVPEERHAAPHIEHLERRAQQEIARGIQKVLFGERCL